MLSFRMEGVLLIKMNAQEGAEGCGSASQESVTAGGM